jgi:eukaryotic-like serine/threonine-protein kinase
VTNDHELPGYVLHQRIGVGANAEVFRAEPVGRPGRVVAVKRLRVDAPARAVDDLRREADALARLSHPSILRVEDLVTDGDRLALVTPYAPGGSLADRLAAADGGLDPAEVADLGARIARALAAAHNAGFVHRDVKPGNVLFDAEGQPLLGDFGIARLTADVPPVAGTAEYLDPETLTGAAPDVRSDVYGLGVTLYEALTGVPPYAGSTPRQTLAAADRGLHLPLTDLGDVPDALADTIRRAMARSPGSRHATATDLAGELDEVHRQLEAGAVPPAPRPTHIGSAGVLGQVDDRADVERSSTVLFGPAPPPPPEEPTPVRGRGRLLLSAALVLAVPLGLVWWLTGASGDEVELARCADAPPHAAASDSPQTEVVHADVEGRGCTVPVAWDGRGLDVPLADGSVARYDLAAAPEDQLLLGDWNCDGRATPALYRPSDGRVFVFDEFAEDAVARGEPSGVVGGRPSVVTDEAGCHRVHVEATS